MFVISVLRITVYRLNYGVECNALADDAYWMGPRMAFAAMTCARRRVAAGMPLTDSWYLFLL